MENITRIFNDAHAEFKKSKASEQSVENLYNLIYLLQERNRDFEENFVLARLYKTIGNQIEAIKIIESVLINANKKESTLLKTLLSEIDQQNVSGVKHYRDLREAKLIKSSTQLFEDNILISEQDEGDCFRITISDTIKHIVIANKNLENKEQNISIFVSNDLQKNIEAYWVYKFINQIEWLGNIKNELIDFYNGSDFENKSDRVGKVWFDGLDIMDLYIRIESDETIVSEITFSDYLLDDIGISFSFKDQTIENVEYGC
ncbi:hypothetical protein PYS58_03620 [Chryseobacterium indologenes]|uniref:hypothetical protein n=1 Tax=Chryseobacterium TaxID=59732 RepID=UPI0016233F48|nr:MULTISPECIES: hypothetical protein [Chryseobacterium]MDM1554941.1 hypothetical protein [Chryseobacterium indologenes]WET50222.1 hypothetical protein PYS58_03620 [Chryseobacterium indologenes]